MAPSRRANGRPTRAQASEIQDAIFAAAMSEFSERGFHGGSIVGIAARANVTRATVYNHFSSKEAALEQLNRRAAERGFPRPRGAMRGFAVPRVHPKEL